MTGPATSMAETRRSGGSALWVLGGSAVSGLATYAVQVVVGRAVGLQPFADFAVFWSAALIVALGCFLPLEQETARRVAALAAAGSSVRPLWARAGWVAATVALLAVLVAVAGWSSTSLNPGLLIAFALACFGYALQFPARGVLAGEQRLGAYSVVVVADSLLRLGAAVVLLVAGVDSPAVFALVIGGSSVVAGVLAMAFATAAAPSAPAQSEVHGFVRDGARLLLAAGCMQLLLNSGTLIAKGSAGPGEQQLAAHLIAYMTLARLPVFLFQSLQAVYVARLAGSAHRADAAAVAQLVRRLAALVTVMGAATVVGSAWLGPWAIRIYGPGFEVSRWAATLIALSVAAYLVASVANDVSVALGRHRRIAVAWPAAMVVLVVGTLVVPDLLIRSTGPLVLAAIAAAAILLFGLKNTLPAAPGRRNEDNG